MITANKALPLWVRIVFYIPAAIAFIFVYAWAKLVLWYDYEFTDRAFKRKLKELETRRDVIDQIRALCLDFNDVGRRSKYIPKRIKTRDQMYDHIMHWYGSDLITHELELTRGLKIIDLKKQPELKRV